AWPERTPMRSYMPWKPHNDFGKRGFTNRIFIGGLPGSPGGNREGACAACRWAFSSSPYKVGRKVGSRYVAILPMSTELGPVDVVPGTPDRRPGPAPHLAAGE